MKEGRKEGRTEEVARSEGGAPKVSITIYKGNPLCSAGQKIEHPIRFLFGSKVKLERHREKCCPPNN